MTRPRQRLVAGVCAGFAEHTGLPVTAVRVGTVLLSLAGGAGALLYAWLWVTIPDTPPRSGALPKASLARPAAAPGRVGGLSVPDRGGPLVDGQVSGGAASVGSADATAARAAPVTEILLGLALLAAGSALAASRLGLNVPLAVVIPGIVVLAGVALAWRQFADIRVGARSDSSALLVRALGALLLVAVGILLFFVTGDQQGGWTVVVASVSVLLGVIVVIAPWLVRLSRDLADERSERIRESERAEIAAHLHDSVLQTLALIQQKAGPHSDAARLARAQERELREWLFTGVHGAGARGARPADPADTSGTFAPAEAPIDLPAALRRIVGEIEADFPVQFEVVTVGTAPAVVPDALIAAAREAMLNAAWHAGGTVSVYLETNKVGSTLSVTDRGPGFRLADIPSDRHGVRESIIGRMNRIGGSAAVRPGPGGSGTEILLSLPLGGTATSAPLIGVGAATANAGAPSAATPSAATAGAGTGAEDQGHDEQ